jgi:1-acyl-sn-glycerol-3-phosphate acyltransferase
MTDDAAGGRAGDAAADRAVLAGADRASGERSRRRDRTTPLLAGRVPVTKKAAAGGTAKKTPAKKAPAKKTPASKAPASKATASEAEKAPAKRVPATRAAAKAPAAKVPAAKVPAAKVPAAKAPAVERVPAKRAPAKRAPAVKRVPAKRAPAKRAPAVERAPAKRVPVASSAGRDSVGPAPVAVQTVAIEAIDAVAAEAVSPGTAGTAAPTGVHEPLHGPVHLADGPVPAGGRHSIALALLGQVGQALLETVTARARPADIEARIAAGVDFLAGRLQGDYEMDDFGFDPEFTEAVPLALLRPLYRHWFRVEVRGIEHVPATGGALIVANHSGAIPIDALMASVAVHDEHPQHRFLRTLGADLVFQLPFLAGLARRSGVTLASNPDAERLLRSGELVGVWPEGFKGIGKPFTERYKLQRFGRGGFVSAALRTGTPIIPCSIVGAEETYPVIGNVPSLARLLGLPYLPITPFFPLLGPLGAIPLPSKWLIEFGPPVPTAGYGSAAAEDPMLVFDLTDQIRQNIQQTLYSLLVQRRSIFF